MKMTRLHHLSVTAVTNNHRLDGLKQHKLLIYYAVGQRSTGVSPVKTKVCTPGSCRGESFSLPHLASSSHSHSQARASFLQHQNQQCWADSLSLCHQTGTTAWKDSLTAMAPHSSTLAWKIPWTEEPGGLQSVGSLRVRHHWATSLSLFTFIHWRRKWQPTPVFFPAESQGQRSLVGCRLWGSTESDRLKRLSSSSSSSSSKDLYD